MRDGFSSNRSDFIRTVVGNQIAQHRYSVNQTVARESIDLGTRTITRDDLIAEPAAGEILEYPSWSRAFRLPIAGVAQQRVRENQNATHDSGDGNLLRLAGAHELLRVLVLS